MGSTPLQTAQGHPISVHQADIIVVGGGLAGVTAAKTADENGASVIIVDKGPFGHSGNTGTNWGQSYVTAELSTDDGIAGTEFLVLDVMGILDQDQARHVVQAQIEGRPRQSIERTGNIFQRDDGGNVVGYVSDNAMTVSHDAHTTGAAQLLRSRGVPIFENTMMLDFLLDGEGKAAGVVALDLKDGSAHLFQGKKVILATGGYHWAKGVSAGSPESTGEAHVALLKRGIAFKDMEFPQYDFSGIRPFGQHPDPEKDMLEIGISISANGEVHHRMYNKHKQQFSQKHFQDSKLTGIATFQGAMVTAAKELYAGNGTPGDGSNNGLLFNLIDIMDDPSTMAFPTYKGHIINVEHNMGFEFPDFYETIANEYSSCGTPFTDPATNETEIPGIYAAFVALSAMSSTYSWAQGYMAAKHAASKALDEPFPTYDAREAETILTAAYNKLETKPNGGIRVTEVFRSIQRAFYKGYGFLKNETDMQSALNELRRIQAEDLPKMYCADASRQFNRDWKMALEVESILLCAMGSLVAGRERKESRSPFFRTDFPKMDNDNFLCFLWTSLDREGNWKVRKGPIVDTVMPKSRIKALLNDSDPQYDISVPNRYSRAQRKV
jgi:succinate dehydrogenase/fumarate reductase flavoprotein subunit